MISGLENVYVGYKKVIMKELIIALQGYNHYYDDIADFMKENNWITESDNIRKNANDFIENFGGVYFAIETVQKFEFEYYESTYSILYKPEELFKQLWYIMVRFFIHANTGSFHKIHNEHYYEMANNTVNQAMIEALKQDLKLEV